MSDASPLLPLVESFIHSDEAAATRTLEAMTEEQAVTVLKALPPRLAARVFPKLQVSYAATLLASSDPALFKAVADVLEPKRGATIFMHLPEAVRQRLLPHVPDRLKSEISELLTYPEGSVGRIMSANFFSFHEDTRARDAIRKIRLMAKNRYPASYAYVLSEEDRLVGVINMLDLMIAPPEAKLESVMKTDVFTLDSFMDRKEAARELAKRRFFAAPVVDSENRLLGLIKAEQLIQGYRQDITRDIQKMFGAGGDERVFSPIRYSLRKRLPWLHVNLATAFLAAAVVAAFEDVIARITVLAVFLPVVAGQGGNAGAQSLAIVMRGLVMREVPKSKVRGLILKEAWLGTINGAVTGAVTALVAWLWQGNPYLGLVIGMGMVVNLFFAGLSGAAIPVLMKALRLDPAQCSSIILTTVTDVVGFIAFLGFAVLFQSHLI